MQSTIFQSLDALPRHFQDLLREAGAASYFQSLPWYENLLSNAFPNDTKLRLYGVESEGNTPTALGLFFAQASEKSGLLGWSPVLDELSNFYSLNAGPVISQQAENLPEILDCLVGAITEDRPSWSSIGFGPIDAASPVYQQLAQQLEHHGLVVESYFRHGNWYEDVAGLTFEKYMAKLGKNAKEALRKSRKLDREHDVLWTLTTEPGDLAVALEHYNKVYENSWKEPEMYPDFIPRLMAHTASTGCLRLANLIIDGEPAATQLIVLSGKNAVMLKTAYISKFERYSIGTTVMVRLLEKIVRSDNIDRIDLGAGDEPYKAHWATQRQERWGLLAYNPRTATGLSKVIELHARRVAKPFAKLLPSKKQGR